MFVYFFFIFHSFEEVHEHQQMLYEQLCDVNAQLNKAQNWSKVLKRTFGGALEDKKLYSERGKLKTRNRFLLTLIKLS